MKLPKLLALAVVLVVIATSAFASWVPSVIPMVPVKNVAGTITADSVFFTIPVCPAGASGAMASSDTMSAFKFPPVTYNYNNNAIATSASVNTIRITVWGLGAGINADTLKAFLDVSNDQNGPWNTAAPTILANLIASGGVGAADTTGASYLRQNSTPQTILANGGLTAWSGCWPLKFDQAGASNSLLWKWGRIRLAGDCTSASQVFAFKVEVAVPTDVNSGPSQ